MSILVKKMEKNNSQVLLTECKVPQGFISVRFEDGNAVDTMKEAVSRIKADGQQIVVAFLVGSARHIAKIDSSSYDFPITKLSGDPCAVDHADCDFGGIQFWTVKNTTLNPIKLNGSLVGHWFEDDNARYCYLGNILPDHQDETGLNQTTEAFINIEKALQMIDMNFLDVTRTWCYLRDLLTWYDDFNIARTTFFKQKGVFEALIPSSTGIGACLPEGPSIVLGALAIKPKNSKVRVKEVFSPLQCPAKDYRSSFARASEVETPDHRQLLISGTASIEPGGASVYIDDIDNQIKLTFEVVEAILQAEKYTWQDCSRAIAYYKDAQYLEAWKRYWQQSGKSEIPIVHLHADVCRDDLLFEIELDCLQAK